MLSARSRLGLLTLSVHAKPLARHAVQADPGMYLMIQLNGGSLKAVQADPGMYLMIQLNGGSLILYCCCCLFE